MPYPFPADIAERIQAQIAAGQFGTEDDVIREAIDALENRQQGLGHLQEMIRIADEDIAEGRIAPFDADATKRAVRDRLAEKRVAD